MAVHLCRLRWRAHVHGGIRRGRESALTQSTKGESAEHVKITELEVDACDGRLPPIFGFFLSASLS